MTKQEPRSQRRLPFTSRNDIENLTIKRQEIIRPILEHPREYVLLSVRAMAQRLKTDPATIVRIVRGLGFASYRDFQHHLHELSIAFASPLDSMLSTPGDSSMPADDPGIAGAVGQESAGAEEQPRRDAPGERGEATL